MYKKTTTQLLRDLKRSKSLDNFIEKNENQFINEPLSIYLNELVSKNNLKKSEIIKKSEINQIYAYQIFSGNRSNPSRDKLICLLVAMQLNLDEVQQALKYAKVQPLYAKNKRDSVIIFGVLNKYSIIKINETLFDNEHETL